MTHDLQTVSQTLCVHTARFTVAELADYIDWLYFFHAWGFPPKCGELAHIHNCMGCRQAWIASWPAQQQEKAREAIRLFEDACEMLRQLEADGYGATARIALSSANSEGDDILLADGRRIPLLRQQQPTAEGLCFCLSDFVRPAAHGIPDRIGIFVSCTDHAVEQLYSEDGYRHLLAQTLADRMAEACIEHAHEYTRRSWWGYAPHEHLSKRQLFAGKFQGIRPAVGYPSLPDQSLNFILDGIVDFARAGVTLTENGAMKPHASTSGLMIAHPQAQHFSVGQIGEDQFADYARRRAMEPSALRRFFRHIQ